jgi:hypothetical protein
VNTEHSEHFNIGRYATKLPGFVKKQMPDNAFAYELCQLETAISQLTDPAESLVLMPEALQGLTPEVLMASALLPRTALQLFEFSYPVNTYYRAMKEEQAPKPLQTEASYLVVLRHEDVIWRMNLEDQEYRMLQLLFSGMSVGKALDALSQELQLVETELAAKLSEWFARWMRNHLLAAIESRDESHERKHHAAA